MPWDIMRYLEKLKEAEEECPTQGIFCMLTMETPAPLASPLPSYFSHLEGQKLHAHVYSRPDASTGAPKVKISKFILTQLFVTNETTQIFQML